MTERVLRKGRGAVSNREGRFEAYQAEAFDDGWGSLEGSVPIPDTVVRDEPIRSLITRNQSPDIPFEQSINPYKGCEHGCIYCYARPTHAYLGLSPGLDFETRLFAKVGAGESLERELRKPRYQCKVITLGANTDPYQPIERERRVTREILEVLHDYRHPVVIITKSALVMRDLDLLSKMAALDLVRVMVSVTSLDPALCRVMEPRAAAPHRRIQTIRALHEVGVPVIVNAAPIIPALNDHELEAIFEASAEAGADQASYILLRLPREVADLFKEWLATHFPNRAAHVMSLIRQMRDGEENHAAFGKRFRGTGPFAALLRSRFKVATARLGLNRRDFELRTDLFCRPARAGDQLSLF